MDNEATMSSKKDDHRALLDSLASKISTNLGSDLNDVCYEISMPDDSYFFSTMLFVDVTVASKDDRAKREKLISIVVKRPPLLESVRTLMRTDEQFHNEILFYQRCGKDYPNIARCFYAEEKPPVDTVIVLENVITQRGYDLCQWKYDVPLEYTVAAFQEIARFHAKAYTAKEQRRDEFFDIVKDLREARYYPNTDMVYTFNYTGTRPIEYLRKRGYDKEFCDKLEPQLENTYENVILKTIQPEEPLATLCHGDFTINNALFKKHHGDLKAMLIDFALVRYGSPILDLSTFLCLHCAKGLDKTMLDHVLKVYHDCLIERLAENGMDSSDFTYEALREDYKRKGLFGFFIATFFLAMQMGKSDIGPEEFSEQPIAESSKKLRHIGGDEISEILADMLLRLKEYGCLDHLL